MRHIKIIIAIFLCSPCYAAYTPIVGIPTPTWPSGGLDIARPSLPDPWTTDTAGFYFIERDAIPACSDTPTNGDPTHPRCDFPSSIPAGSVIVINGTYDHYKVLTLTGTLNNEIWIMGYDPENRPVIPNHLQSTFDYVIMDGIDYTWNSDDTPFEVASGAHGHLLVRNCNFTNPFYQNGNNGSALGPKGSNIIIYNNTFNTIGDWDNTDSGDTDRHAIKLDSSNVNISDIWILNNTFQYIQGDAIQVGDTEAASTVANIYVGGNTASYCTQNGFWAKQATDVIFSSNIASHMPRPNPDGGGGGGMGAQYDPVSVWFINNIIHDTKDGIMIAGANNGGGGPFYAVGNLIYNVQNDESVNGSCNAYNYGALMYRNEGGFYAVNNTIADVDSFLVTIRTSGVVAMGNIFSSAKTTVCPAINVAEYPGAMDYNLFNTDAVKFGHDGGAGIDDATIEYTSVTAFRAGESKDANAPVSADPLFVASDNYCIQTTSPAKDTGILSDVYVTFQSLYGLDIRRDITGGVRPYNTLWDIGAYEFGATPPGQRYRVRAAVND